MTTTSLTPRQARFVQCYTAHLNASLAARESGYSASSGADAVTACRLLRNNRVKAAIQARQQAKADELELTRQGVIAAVLAATKMAQEQGAPAIMIRGWVQIAKLSGFYDTAIAEAELHENAESKADLRYLSTAELLQKISTKGELRNADGSMMQLAQIDAFYKGLSDVEINVLAQGRARVVTKIEMIHV